MKSKIPLIPYVPTPEDRIETIFKLVKIRPGIRGVDLGAGDGRLVIALAKKGAEAHGYEIQEKYARRAKTNIAREKLSDRAFIYQEDFWSKDLSSFDLVVIYGMVTILEQLAEKLSRELKKGAIVVSNGFKIPGWKVWKEENYIFLYIKD